jgi:hypothetical protein
MRFCIYGKGMLLGQFVVILSTYADLFLFFWVNYSGHGSTTYQIAAGEELEVSIYTRSTGGAKFTVTDVNKAKTPWVTDYDVTHTGTDDAEEHPTHDMITKTKIMGPASVKVKADSNAGRWSAVNFLVVFWVYSK